MHHYECPCLHCHRLGAGVAAGVIEISCLLYILDSVPEDTGMYAGTCARLYQPSRFLVQAAILAGGKVIEY